MENVIDVAFHVTWDTPVFVRIGNGFRERIDGPDAALSELLHRWPSNGCPEYAVAKRRCLDAIARHGSPALARSTFIEAAIVAKVLA
ncbi:Protein of unknown function (DUF982) [Rhizobium leguminosarum bv. trifolii WSM597]|uniref:DUF982 domain-containing protein n=1 Tax=Rhizobium leguminosarum bv. trifolii WSM597 TaxID=754764 RepID=I9N518_RHILT|nr:DUF982 domain-containing protein [Rhizobium leguminosarum]EJB01787.1 Protein of unknown function (DUF982) [Rhizobium leguminosarum bv. trifolii WSM597]